MRTTVHGYLAWAAMARLDAASMKGLSDTALAERYFGSAPVIQFETSGSPTV